MTRDEFVKAMAYLTAGCGKSLEKVSLQVYFDLLGDLEFDTLLVAAKRVLLKHRFPTFPTVAELREAAVLTRNAEVTALAPAEAWALAWRAVASTDPEIDGSFARATAKLPPLIVKAIEVFGLQSLCYGGEPVTVIRAQFMKIYEQLGERVRQEELLPPATRRAIAAQSRPRVVEASPALALAGWMPEAPPGK